MKRKPYWEDECPICGELAISACRCMRNERWCKNNHHWRRDENENPIMCGSNHTDIGPPPQKNNA